MATGIYFHGSLQLLANDGTPLALGKVETFVPGTALSVHKATYQDAALTTPHPWPVTLNGNGRAAIFLGAGAYDIVIKDAGGNEMAQLLGFAGAGISVTVVATSAASYTPTFGGAGQILILVDASAANATVNLPAISANDLGKTITVKKTDASAFTVTVDGNGGELIDASLTRVLRTQQASVTVMEAATNWPVIAQTVGFGEDPSVCQGRLTLTSGNPFPTVDVVNGNRIFYTPEIGNLIALYTGAGWAQYEFSELEINLTNTPVLSGMLYDVCVKDVGGAATLTTNAWRYAGQAITGATNATPIVITSNAHGLSNGDEAYVSGVEGNLAANGSWIVANVTANTFELVGSAGSGAYTAGGWMSARKSTGLIVRQNGVQVLTSDRTSRVVGTFLSTSTQSTSDAITARLLANLYRPIGKDLRYLVAQNSYNYSTATWRLANNDNSAKFTVVVPMARHLTRVDYNVSSSNASADSRSAGIGLNRTTGPVTGSRIDEQTLIIGAVGVEHHAYYEAALVPGSHVLAPLEIATGTVNTTTWYGDNNTPTINQQGFFGRVWV